MSFVRAYGAWRVVANAQDSIMTNRLQGPCSLRTLLPTHLSSSRTRLLRCKLLFGRSVSVESRRLWNASNFGIFDTPVRW